MAIKVVDFYGVPMCLVFILSGCATSSTSQEESFTLSFVGYREHAEDVFRRQNRVTSEIMMLLDDEMDSDDYETLLKEEQEMNKACELLNEYAVRYQEGESISVFFWGEVNNSVEPCDYAVRDVEAVLNKINNGLQE